MTRTSTEYEDEYEDEDEDGGKDKEEDEGGEDVDESSDFILSADGRSDHSTTRGPSSPTIPWSLTIHH